MRLFDLLDKLINNENLYAIKDKSMFGVSGTSLYI